MFQWLEFHDFPYNNILNFTFTTVTFYYKIFTLEVHTKFCALRFWCSCAKYRFRKYVTSMTGCSKVRESRFLVTTQQTHNHLSYIYNCTIKQHLSYCPIFLAFLHQASIQRRVLYQHVHFDGYEGHVFIYHSLWNAPQEFLQVRYMTSSRYILKWIIPGLISKKDHNE